MYYFIWLWFILEILVEGDYLRLKLLLIYLVFFLYLFGIFILKCVFCSFYCKFLLMYIFVGLWVLKIFAVE